MRKLSKGQILVKEVWVRAPDGTAFKYGEVAGAGTTDKQAIMAVAMADPSYSRDLGTIDMGVLFVKPRISGVPNG